MTSLRFHIRFPENKIKEPIIYQIGHEFRVVTNVRRADVRETTGWMDLELTGETEEIERAIDGIGELIDRQAQIATLLTKAHAAPKAASSTRLS